MLTGDQVNALLCNALAERTEWDEPPAVYVITDDDEPRLDQLDVPVWMWSAAEPGVMLWKLAAFGSLWLPSLPAGFFGVAFRFEAWVADVTDSALSDADRERLRRASVERDIHLQPERRETRSMMACDLDGGCYWVQQYRGSEPELVPDAYASKGRIRQSLTLLAERWAQLAL
jgi:hypothetical protein